jgi:hypothetical protein
MISSIKSECRRGHPGERHELGEENHAKTDDDGGVHGGALDQWVIKLATMAQMTKPRMMISVRIVRRYFGCDSSDSADPVSIGSRDHGDARVGAAGGGGGRLGVGSPKFS